MPKRPPVIGQSLIGDMLDRLPASREGWGHDTIVLMRLASLEFAARELMAAFKANEDRAYARLYGRCDCGHFQRTHTGGPRMDGTGGLCFPAGTTDDPCPCDRYNVS